MAHKGATAIIKSITSLAEALGLETTAEGVETIDQLDILREQGCNQIKGYYFSKPVPADEVRRMFGDQTVAVRGSNNVISNFQRADVAMRYVWTEPALDEASEEARRTGTA